MGAVRSSQDFMGYADGDRNFIFVTGAAFAKVVTIKRFSISAKLSLMALKIVVVILAILRAKSEPEIVAKFEDNS